MDCNDRMSMLALNPLNSLNMTIKIVENLPIFLVNPKPATLTIPTLFISKFAGFKSR